MNCSPIVRYLSNNWAAVHYGTNDYFSTYILPVFLTSTTDQIVLILNYL